MIDFADIPGMFLELPINGTVYRIDGFAAKDKAKVDAALDKDADSALSDEEFSELMLGPALARMRADGVSVAAVAMATLTAVADYQSGRATAEAFWATRGEPSRLPAFLAELDRTDTPAPAPAPAPNPRPKAKPRTPTKATPARKPRVPRAASTA